MGKVRDFFSRIWRGKPKEGRLVVTSTKSVRPQEVVVTSTPRVTSFTRRNALEEAMKASVWVYRCVSVIALSAASVPFVGYRRLPDGNREELEVDHPLQKLLRRPNEEWGWAQFVTYLTQYMELGGEGFVTKVRAISDGSSELYPERGLPAELWVYPPDQFAPVPGKEGQPFVRLYKARGSSSAPDVQPEDMVHPMFPNPSNLYRGLAPLEAADSDVDSDVRAGEWQAAAFDNMAVPPGIFKFDPNLSDEQWEEAKAHFKSEYMGSKNARRPMMLGNEVEWIDLAKSAIEMDFQNGRKLSRESICGAFGVPPVLVGILDRATYSNFAQAEVIFWKLKMLPYLDLLKGSFNAGLAPEFGEDVEIDYDTSGVDALLPIFKERCEVGRSMVDAGVPLSVANRRLQLGIEPFGGWDRSWKPSSEEPVGRDEAVEETELESEEEELPTPNEEAADLDALLNRMVH
jgi:HK97 family phage portal protein